MQLQHIVSFWNEFFHGEMSCASLGLFRILLGLILVTNAVLLLPLIDDYFSADGLWPIHAWRNYSKWNRFCLLHLLPPTTSAFRVLWLTHFLSSLCFLIGFRFSIASIVVFLTLVSIHHRNGYILSSGDTLMRIFTFLMVFGSGGECLSMDSWLAGRPLTDFPVMDPWPLRIIQLQICIVYVRTVYWKLRGRRWWDGTAAWYPLWVDPYVRYRPPKWVLNRFTIRVATWGTLVEEAALGTLVWVHELRYPLVFSGMLFHLMLDVTMNLQFFSWIMISALTTFFRPEDVEHVVRWFAS